MLIWTLQPEQNRVSCTIHYFILCFPYLQVATLMRQVCSLIVDCSYYWLVLVCFWCDYNLIDFEISVD